MTDAPALGGSETWAETADSGGYYGEGATERETRLALAEIAAETPLTGPKRAIKQLCMSLALSIDKGNTKGRAVANEAMQLASMLSQLSPVAAGSDVNSDALSPELKRLLDAFASPAQFEAPASSGADDPAPVRNTPEL